MILTVSPTPAIDVTYAVDAFRVGDQMRSTVVRKEASGKAVNVSAALAQLGWSTVAVVALSPDPIGRAWRELASDLAFPVVDVPVSAQTRLNTTVRDGSGRTTRINEPVEPLSPGDLAAVLERTEQVAHEQDARWVVCSGSIAPPNAHDLLAGLQRIARSAGARLAVDTSGLALQRAVELGVDLLKPNIEELAFVTGAPLPDVEAVVDATGRLAARSGSTVLATLGRDGAVVSDGITTEVVAALARPVVNTTGAGDATLAGFLAASLASPSLAECARSAMRWGMAAAAHTQTVGLDPETADALIADERSTT